MNAVEELAKQCGAVQQFGYRNQEFYCMTSDKLAAFVDAVTQESRLQIERLTKEITKLKSDQAWVQAGLNYQQGNL